MRKEVALFLVLFLALNFVVAADDVSDVAQDLASVDVTQETNKVLATEVTIPENVRPVVRVLFGIDENMTFSKFVVYLMVWLFVFLVVFQIVKIMPFFKQGPAKFVAALAISILAGNWGGIEAVVTLYYDLGIARFIDTASPGAFFLAVVVIVVVYFVLSRIISKVSRALEEGDVESSAMEAGAGYKILRIISRVMGRTSGSSSTSKPSNPSESSPPESDSNENTDGEGI